MMLSDLLYETYSAVTVNKARTGLTILGIVYYNQKNYQLMESVALKSKRLIGEDIEKHKIFYEINLFLLQKREINTLELIKLTSLKEKINLIYSEKNKRINLLDFRNAIDLMINEL